MLYIIIGLLVIILIILITSNKNNDTVKELSNLKFDLTKNINNDFTALNDRIDLKLDKISEKVNERLDDNFMRANKTFTSILERLTKIDEAQKKLDNLSGDIISLQSVLTDKKTRGVFGEVNLAHIMSNVFGENNTNIYKMQYKFNNNVIADCALFAPSPLGTIAIDAKFPLENFQNMVDKNKTNGERNEYEKKFKTDLKKHIDDIASKYIIEGVTTNQAILFLPAEAIFAEINAYHNDILEYAYKKRIWLTSPTTLISTLTTLEVIIKNMERDKYASIIQNELKLLSLEFARYKDRWDKLAKNIESVNNDIKDINITSDKISKRFVAINNVDDEQIKIKG
jgi:DNA recombination protein RmuC